MNDTIFSPSFGNRPQTMVGREDVRRQLAAALESRPGSRDRAVLLLGQRGSGKTVLLLDLAERARDKGFIVASPTVVAPGMCHRIMEKLEEAADDESPSSRQISGGSITIMGMGAGLQTEPVYAPEHRSFASRISAFTRSMSKRNRGVLVLIDEVQADNEELRQLVIAYQEMVGEGLNVAMVLAGLPAALSSLLNDKVLTFLNRAVKTTLPPIPVNEIDAFYVQAFAQTGVHLSREKRKEAAAATEGSPYLLQLIGHYLVLYADSEGNLEGAAFSEAISSAREDFLNDVCGTTIAALSGRDLDFLYAMAQVNRGAVSLSEIGKRMNVTPQYAQNYKKRLIQAGIISQPGRGIVAFSVPYLREYLLRSVE